MRFSLITETTYVLTVPMYKEPYDFIEQFAAQFSEQSVLLILVVNQPGDDDNTAPQEALIKWIHTQCSFVEKHQHLSFYSLEKSKVKILLVARFEGQLRIPAKLGVGLARKIGVDCAIALIASGIVAQPMVGSTDADAVLPERYLQCLSNTSQCVAAIFDFQHTKSHEKVINEATLLYEQRLHHYIAGLKFAKSPYAFHTIGSCFAIHYRAYAQVRGFPKKSAGEDFYLLNKLAKVGNIAHANEKIRIRSRLSSRVPFGTGPAVSEIVAGKQTIDNYRVYDPVIFVRLRELIELFGQLKPDYSQYELLATNLSQVTTQYLQETGFSSLFCKWCRQYKSKQQLNKALTDWFDAFRTLKFIHFCRAKKWPDIPLKQALAKRIDLGF